MKEPGWAQVGLEVIALGAAAMWTVGEVKSTTKILAVEVRHLAEAVEDWSVKQDGDHEAIADLRTRMARVEDWREEHVCPVKRRGN